MAPTEFQTEPNRLHTAVDGMIGEMILKEINSKDDLTLSDITEACHDPEKLRIYRDALKTFMSSPMTSTHVSALSKRTCNARNCSIRQKCTDVLIADVYKSE